MIHSTVEYWRYINSLPPGHEDRPTARVCHLLDRAFQRWQDRPRWPSPQQMCHLFEGDPDRTKRLATLPVAVRRGMAIRETLRRATLPEVAEQAGTFSIHPDELVVGCIPPYSVGQGKELVGHLTQAESLHFSLEFLNDRSSFGHIVPDHETVLKKGLRTLIGECKSKTESLAKKKARSARDERSINFYRSVVEALEGVIEFATAYSAEASRIAERLPLDDVRRTSLNEIAVRLERIPAEPAQTFHDAVQCIFIVHCALHTSGEIVPLGRLDQLLYPYYERDSLSGMLPQDEELRTRTAQELIDCLWVKLGERATLDHRHVEDRFTFADGSLLGLKGPSNFDQGGLLNQWMQQVTIGGYTATDDEVPTDGTNPITFLCLEAARRLPVNSPTLDLRLHRKLCTPDGDKLFLAAARTILSGGAHPILMNDDLIVPALKNGTGGTVELSSARNYACDGCYETLFAGETEFTFGMISAVEMLENALNRGAGIAASGPMHLRGWKRSLRTTPAEEINSFEEVLGLFREHLEVACHRYYHGVLKYYGEKEEVAPSPLLSAMIRGCLEKGRDLTGGGARYHLVSPLLVGLSTCVDSLHSLRRLVFEENMLSLDELVSCLRGNWGERPSVIEPRLPQERVREIRKACLSQQKFGQGHEEVDRLAWDLIRMFYDIAHSVRVHEVHAPALRRLREEYGKEFELLIAPGVGTFEQYVFSGSFCGATPDGRLAGQPVASDLSPAPLPADLEPTVADGKDRINHIRQVRLFDGMRSYFSDSVNLLSDGAPGDLNLPEEFPVDELVKAIRHFAEGKAGNILTFTVADPQTFLRAIQDPSNYDLLRVRMGGWSEFFIALCPDHQQQHRRRPLFVPSGGRG